LKEEAKNPCLFFGLDSSFTIGSNQAIYLAGHLIDKVISVEWNKKIGCQSIEDR